MRKIIASIDVGSYSIKIVVGEIQKNKLNILATSDLPSNGIKRGIVTNPEEFKKSLKTGLDSINDTLGVKLTKVIVSIPSFDAKFCMSEGKTTITNQENMITGNDIARCLQGCVYNKIRKDEELVSIMPIYFMVDEEKKVRDPKRIIAKRLSAKAVISSVPKENIYNMLSVMEDLGLEIIDLTFANVGDYYATQYEELDESIGAVVNIGHELTNISIFNKGVMSNSTVLNLGGKNIENDITYIYKTTAKDSNTLKEKLALAHKQMASSNVKEKVTNKLGEEITINQFEISEIVMSRLVEILNLVKKEINYLTKKEISYIIFTGGVTESNDFNLVLKNVFATSASVMHLKELGVRNNKFSACVGMIKYFNNKMVFRDKEFSALNLDDQVEISSYDKTVNVSENSVLGKLFGYFFDN